jgi:cytochrome b6-f complex iron-sulfur subunit
MSNQPETITRRDTLKVGWVAAGALLFGEGLFVGLRFLAPRVAEGEFGSLIIAGAVESFPPGSVTPFNEGRFYLVRLADGGFLAVYRRCTHLGCTVPYDPLKGQFVCPCHGSAFSMDGQVLNPPAPRPLDLFDLTISDGQIMVNTGNRIEREHAAPAQIVYA